MCDPAMWEAIQNMVGAVCGAAVAIALLYFMFR